jgi:hypothetical protein
MNPTTEKYLSTLRTTGATRVEVAPTGGNCWALDAYFANGLLVSVSDGDAMLPDDPAYCSIGVYDKFGPFDALTADASLDSVASVVRSLVAAAEKYR